jgi:hypothetical protein
MEGKAEVSRVFGVHKKGKMELNNTPHAPRKQNNL